MEGHLRGWFGLRGDLLDALLVALSAAEVPFAGLVGFGFVVVIVAVPSRRRRLREEWRWRGVLLLLRRRRREMVVLYPGYGVLEADVGGVVALLMLMVMMME